METERSMENRGLDSTQDKNEADFVFRSAKVGPWGSVMLVSDISFLARLVSGESMLEGSSRDELAGLSPIFQPVARRLVPASPHERQPIWDDFLAGRLRPDPIAAGAHESALGESPTRKLANATVRSEPQPPLPT